MVVEGIGGYVGLNSTTLTVNKVAPTYTKPENLIATYGDTLADVMLPQDWAWQDDLTTSVGNAGENEFVAIYTPVDLQNYNIVTEPLMVTVSKAIPTPTELPEEFVIVEGEKLSTIVLPEGWT